MPAKTKPRKRRAVIERLKRGETRHSVAKATGVPKSTVQAIAEQEGLAARPDAKAQTRAARDFNQAAQVDLLNRIVAKVEELLPSADTLTKAKDGALTTAICIDKRRLIDGKPTERTETNVVDELSRRIARLAERRGEGGGAGGSDPGAS